MAIAVQSVATAAWTTATSVVITKPTGLAVGDLMVAVIAGYQGATPAPALPAGWTSIATLATSPYASAMYKVAEASDASATDFTFTATDADYMAGVLYRIDGFQSPLVVTGDADEDTGGVTAGAFTFTKALTPLIADAHVISAFVESNNDGASVNFGTYTMTGSPTFTERLDTQQTITADSAFAVADAPYDSTTEIVSAGASVSATTDRIGNILILIHGSQDALGTNTLLSVSPTHLAQNGVAGVTGTNDFLEVSPTLLDQSGKVTTLTQWSNETRPTTDWNNDTL